MNKLHTAVRPVIAIDKDGAPIEPARINTNWRNDCGVLVRRKINITYDSWPEVPKGDKETLWNSLSVIYRSPLELYECGKEATLKTMGRCLRTFRNTLKNNFVDKDVTPFERYGFITPDDWKKFVVKASSKNFKQKSEHGKSLSKKNIFRPNLGPGGYKAKLLKWRQMEERLRLAGIPNPLEGCSERTKTWLLGRSKSTDDGQLIPKSSGVKEVLQRAKELARKEKEGTFIPVGNKDQLSVALGTHEHRGCTRGVSSLAKANEGLSGTTTCTRCEP